MTDQKTDITQIVLSIFEKAVLDLINIGGIREDKKTSLLCFLAASLVTKILRESKDIDSLKITTGFFHAVISDSYADIREELKKMDHKN